MTPCRADGRKWTPSRCLDCIKVAEKLFTAGREEKKLILKSFDIFIKSLESFVRRVSALSVNQTYPLHTILSELVIEGC